LNESDREQIWLRFDEGSANMTQLAKRFGVSVATISRELANRRRRGNVARRVDEAPHSEQCEKQCPPSPRQSGQDETVSLAEGRERKSRRASAQNAAH
jgi:DeoR/GlpR family transcriptional regulator of sugar metabolism